MCGFVIELELLPLGQQVLLNDAQILAPFYDGYICHAESHDSNIVAKNMSPLCHAYFITMVLCRGDLLTSQTVQPRKQWHRGQAELEVGKILPSLKIETSS
jgi:hypothetical protein